MYPKFYISVLFLLRTFSIFSMQQSNPIDQARKELNKCIQEHDAVSRQLAIKINQQSIFCCCFRRKQRVVKELENLQVVAEENVRNAYDALFQLNPGAAPTHLTKEQNIKMLLMQHHPWYVY